MDHSEKMAIIGKFTMRMNNTALLVIDVQKGLDDPSLGRRSTPAAEANIALLLAQWRQRRLPIVHIRHCSVEPHSKLRPELPGNAFKDQAQPLPGEIQYWRYPTLTFS